MNKLFIDLSTICETFLFGIGKFLKMKTDFNTINQKIYICSCATDFNPNQSENNKIYRNVEYVPVNMTETWKLDKYWSKAIVRIVYFSDGSTYISFEF